MVNPENSIWDEIILDSGESIQQRQESLRAQLSKNPKNKHFENKPQSFRQPVQIQHTGWLGSGCLPGQAQGRGIATTQAPSYPKLHEHFDGATLEASSLKTKKVKKTFQPFRCMHLCIQGLYRLER